MKSLKKYKKVLRLLVFPLFFSLIGAIIGGLVVKFWPISQNERMKNLYEDEMSVFVSPTTVKKWIDNGDTNYILVDLRSAAEYNQEHFKTAINIPSVSMNTDQLVAAFRALPKDREIIVHCYSAYCTLGRTVGKTLAEHGIFVHELDVGWSELKYHWDLWNPGAKTTDGEGYIVKGTGNSSTEPGTIKPCVAGQFGC